MNVIVTADEERIDRIAKALYGTEQGGTVEALLKANPGLAERGPMIPRDVRIAVPPRPVPKPDPALVRPWE